jgi:8-oxo-dGTP diphosphatase
MPTIRIPCAGGIVFDESRRLLVIRRARPPAAGLWSIPGGKSLPGESTAATCVREVFEETGFVVEVTHLAGRVELPSTDRPTAASAQAADLADAAHAATSTDTSVYEVDDYFCLVRGGELRAQSDATEARWVTLADLEALEVVPGLLASLDGWQALPR